MRKQEKWPSRADSFSRFVVSEAKAKDTKEPRWLSLSGGV
jgi:hypothetical protein